MIETIREELALRARRHQRSTRAFGGVRHSAVAIRRLLEDWNKEVAESRPAKGKGEEVEA